MGREIRMVPENWDHPKNWVLGTKGPEERFHPMFDRSFDEAAALWTAEFIEWQSGKRPDYCDEESAQLPYWEWAGMPPEREYYRPWQKSEAVWIQVWETVSEGTPVSPPFATPKELVDYLATNGDFWDQERGDGPWDRADAESFVERGWAPTLVTTGSETFAPRDGLPA
jgi:hypothetical protein